jgi:hypothetical protein
LTKKDILEILNPNRISKAELNSIVEMIESDQKIADYLFEIVIDPENYDKPRPAWVLNYAAIQYPELFRKYFGRLIELCKLDVHAGIHRSIMRIFESVDIGEDLEGPLFDICIDFLQNTKRPKAVRAFSLTAATRIALKYPEIASEMIEVIKNLEDVEAPSLKSRLWNCIKDLQRLVN